MSTHDLSRNKKFGGSGNTLETYDYHFISGPKHLHKIEDVCISLPEERLIKIGYPKFDDYVNQKVTCGAMNYF